MGSESRRVEVDRTVLFDDDVFDVLDPQHTTFKMAARDLKGGSPSGWKGLSLRSCCFLDVLWCLVTGRLTGDSDCETSSSFLAQFPMKQGLRSIYVVHTSPVVHHPPPLARFPERSCTGLDDGA